MALFHGRDLLANARAGIATKPATKPRPSWLSYPDSTLDVHGWWDAMPEDYEGPTAYFDHSYAEGNDAEVRWATLMGIGFDDGTHWFRDECVTRLGYAAIRQAEEHQSNGLSEGWV